MENDYFESSTISMILSWIFCVPVLIGILSFCIQWLYEKQEEVPRLYTIWLFLCIFIFSPLRYIILQIIAATCFIFQSFNALLNSIVLAFYVPIFFGLLYVMGIGIPLFIVIWITSGLKNEMSKTRLWFGSLIMPIVLSLGTYLFFLVLPIGASTIHWIKAEDVIRASNGPTSFTYSYIAKWGMPIQFPYYAQSVATTDKALLRTHMAVIYLSEEEHLKYIKTVYPNFIESLRKLKEEQY